MFSSFLHVFYQYIYNYTVLSYGIKTVTNNVTPNSRVVAEKCGANFCGVSGIEDENPNLQRPPIDRIYLISGIYLGCMILACLIITFGVDSLSRYNSAFISRSSTKHTETFYLHNVQRGYICILHKSFLTSFLFLDTIGAEPAWWKKPLDLNSWPRH